MRQRDKISTLIPVREDLRRHEDADLLIFHIPEAHRSEKPVFLDGDIRRAFARSGGSDVRLSAVERDRFLVDAAAERYDGQPVDFDPDRAFDEDSLRWYRAAYESRPGNRSYSRLDDLEFLGVMGLLREEGSAPRLTRAAILLFGSDRTFRQLLPRMVVDCQRFRLRRDETPIGERWFDRLVLEDNLVRTWRALIVAGLTPEEAVSVADRLATQLLLETTGPGRYRLARHLGKEFGKHGHRGSDHVRFRYETSPGRPAGGNGSAAH